MRMLRTAIHLFAAFLVLSAAGCAAPGPSAGKAPKQALGKKCVDTFEILRNCLEKKEYDRAYLLFSDGFRDRRIGPVEKMAELAAHDGEMIIASEVIDFHQGFDWGRSVIAYGGKRIKVFYIFENGTWLISTREEAEKKKNASSPIKAVYGVYQAMINGDVDRYMSCVTPYLRRKVSPGHLKRVLDLYVRGKATLDMHGHYALSRSFDTKSNRGYEIHFVKRGGRWLIAAPDEYERTREMYGDEF